MKKFLKLLVTCLLAFSLVMMAAGCGGQEGENGTGTEEQTQQGAETINLTIASGPAGGTWYPLGGAVAKIIQDNIPGTVVSVQQGGGVANAKGVDQGVFDIGITYSHTAAEALAGDGSFEKPATNLCALTGLYPSALQIVVRAGSDIKQVEDLKGKRISPGRKGLSGEALTRTVLKVHGLSYEDMAKVEYVSYSDSVNLMKDRQIDMYDPITTWPAPSIQQIALAGGVRLLPIRPEKMKELKEINAGFSYITLKADTYKGMTEDTPCVGSNAILVVRKDLPEDLVYKITKAIIENRDQLVNVHKTTSYLTPETATKDLGCELHPGAEKYYKEIGAL